ncbi:hypothetical protein [Planktothrix sp.]
MTFKEFLTQNLNDGKPNGVVIVQIIEEEFMSKRMTMAQRINRKKKKGKKIPGTSFCSTYYMGSALTKKIFK